MSDKQNPPKDASAGTSTITSIRRVQAVTVTISYDLKDKLQQSGIVFETDKGLFLDILALEAVPYARTFKTLRFLQWMVFIQQISIIYLLYKCL